MLFLLIRRGLRQHLVSTAVAVLLVALGLGLVISVWVVRAEAEQSFTRSASALGSALLVASHDPDVLGSFEETLDLAVLNQVPPQTEDLPCYSC